MQAKDIDELLKKGSYDVFCDDDATEAQHFIDTDIDQLLVWSSQTITYGSSGKSTMSRGLETFCKADFFALTEDGSGQDVTLDYPDFW